MNGFSRLLLSIFCLLLLAVAGSEAGLRPIWTRHFGAAPGTRFTVEETHFDDAQNVIIAGTVQELGQRTDILVVKLEAATGSVVWVFRKTGLLDGDDKLGGIAVAGNGDVLVAGAITNEPSPAVNPLTDAYLARIDGKTGIPVWELPTATGLPGEDGWRDVAINGQDVLVTGSVTGFSGTGSDFQTAKYNFADGGEVWRRPFTFFGSPIAESGERLFVDRLGNIWVQGRHAPGSDGGTLVDSTIVVLQYTPLSELPVQRRFREAPNVAAFGFVPEPATGGFLIGFSITPENTPTFLIARGRADGTPVTEQPLPLVAANPVMALAVNGDILFTGRAAGGAGVDPRIVAGRLAPGDLSTHWAAPVPNASPGPGAGFAHLDFGGGGSVVAGIEPGATTPDLSLAQFDKEGRVIERVLVDGGTPTVPVVDALPGGPALDTDGNLGLAVAVLATGPGGEAEIVVQRMRVFTPPTGVFVNPAPANPNVPAFQPVNLEVAASDADNDPVTVEFLVDGISLGAIDAAPFQIPHTFAPGQHSIGAIVRDASGDVTPLPALTVQAQLPAPVVTTGAAIRTGPETAAFSGTVTNIPLGGTATGQLQLVENGVPTGGVFTTETQSVAPGTGPVPVEIPFSIQPHQTYRYQLVVSATDGTQVVNGSGDILEFTVPNAPVIATEDFFFAPRGKITGAPLENDHDGDPGETLLIQPAGSNLPGKFEIVNGGFTFVPGKEFTGEAMFDYVVDDGHGSSVTQTVIVRNALQYAGTYRALPPTDGGQLGCVDVVVNKAGRASALIFIEGSRHAAAGMLKKIGADLVGFNAVIRRRGEPEVQVLLAWDLAGELTAYFGVGDGNLFTATGGKAVGSPFSENKVYTLLGTHTNVVGNPGGRTNAFAHLRIALDGKVTFRGRVGDGTAFTTIARMQSGARLPVYAPLQGRPRSFLVGHMQPGEDDVASVGPLMAVQGPGKRGTPVYASDYRDQVSFAGGRFQRPPELFTFATEPRLLRVAVTQGPLAGAFYDLPVWMSRRGSLSGISGITRIVVDAQTGEFSGAFLPPGQFRTIPFAGILPSGVNGGTGVIRTQAEAATIALQPQ